MQKALYQQQPLQVMLRGQQQVLRPMPMIRPPQRTVNGQSNVASLSIHDKRRQPVMPVKRHAGCCYTTHGRDMCGRTSNVVRFCTLRRSSRNHV